jgi:hypothetical protein
MAALSENSLSTVSFSLTFILYHHQMKKPKKDKLLGKDQAVEIPEEYPNPHISKFSTWVVRKSKQTLNLGMLLSIHLLPTSVHFFHPVTSPSSYKSSQLNVCVTTLSSNATSSGKAGEWAPSLTQPHTMTASSEKLNMSLSCQHPNSVSCHQVSPQ